MTCTICGRAQKMIACAKAVVERWPRKQLCSLDYIDRWI